MTTRQRFLKLVYPFWMFWARLKDKHSKTFTADKTPKTPFHSLEGTLNNGSKFDFNKLKGKKILIVNTASNCGYTNQYESLEKLQRQYKDKLQVIGFPANDFKEQEKGSDAEIAEFCKINYGTSFLLMKKSSVIKGPQQNEVFDWLSNPAKNGWNSQEPTWNFCKYIIDEKGTLTNFFGPATDPGSGEILKAIK